MNNVLRMQINGFRSEIGELSTQIRTLGPSGNTGLIPGSELHGEFRANITLAFRHLEDARMRLGKAIQALDGGISIYDK